MGLFNKLLNKDADTKPKEDAAKMKETLDNFDKLAWDSFLENETKFRHQDVQARRSSSDDSATLGYILDTVLGIDKDDIGPMTIVSRSEGTEDKTEYIADRTKVLEFNLFSILSYKDRYGEPYPIHGQNVTLVISYRRSKEVFDEKESRADKSKLCVNNSIIVFLRGLPFFHGSAYMRVSIMVPNASDVDDLHWYHSKNAPFTKSIVLAHYIVSNEDKLKRYDQVDESLQSKMNTGDMNLNEDERTILGEMTGCKKGDDLDYGKWLIDNHRYADSLLCLTRLYKNLSKKFVKAPDQTGPLFTEVCYLLGTCYEELEQHDKAAYYLQLAGDDKIEYIMEFINALVNAQDVRALRIVHDYISEFQSGTRKVDSQETAFFYNFLHRRLAYLFVTYEMWDNARHLLTQLDKNPDCHDFAVQELAYIERVTQPK
jgi:hypothetical protein